MEATDVELLAAFARNRSEAAFRQLVDRHLRMVFATARRMLDDTHEAEEIAQTVFQLLAEKAGAFDQAQPLAGWLYRTARHHALHRLRSEGRRRQREQTAFAMQTSPESSPPETGLIHELEDALDELESDERDALVLRFLEDRQLKEVGAELGVSEEAARKRVTRALDRLRGIFGRRGITTSTGAITVALVAQSSISVPASLGGTIISAVATGTVLTTTAAVVTQTTSSTLTTMFNLKTTAAVLAAAAVTGTTTYLVKEKEADRLRVEQTAMTAEHARIAEEQQQAIAIIQLRDDQIASLKKDVADLPRLRGEVDRLNRELQAMEQLQTENARLAGLVAKLEQRLLDVVSNQIEEQRQGRAQFVATRIGHVNNLKLLALVTRIYANNHDESYPDNWNDPGFLEALSQATAGQNSLTDDYNPSHYEQVYFGKDPSDPSIVVIRQRDPMVDPNGTQWKLYATADGAVHSIREEQVGSFEQFEQNWTLRREPFVFEQSQR